MPRKSRYCTLKFQHFWVFIFSLHLISDFSLPMVVLSCSVMSNSVAPGTVAHQALLSVGFTRQAHQSGLLLPALGDLPDPGIEPEFLASPALASGFFITSASWEALSLPRILLNFLPEALCLDTICFYAFIK